MSAEDHNRKITIRKKKRCCVCVRVLVICVLVLIVYVFFGLCKFILICYMCKNYCHQVKIQLWLIIIKIKDNKPQNFTQSRDISIQYHDSLSLFVSSELGTQVTSFSPRIV